MSVEIRLTDQEIKIICDALNVYCGQQYDAVAFFADRLSSTAYSVLEDELNVTGQLYDKLWEVLQNKALGEEEE